MRNPPLPRVFINVAITADGKIAPDTRRFVPFGSERDRSTMMELRSRADAVMSGARTVDLAKADLGPGGMKYQRQRLAQGLAEFNLRVIVSGSGSVDHEAHIFSQRFSPILLLTTEAAPRKRIDRLGALVDDVFTSPGDLIDLRAALGWLKSKWGVKRLLCEGGGEINAALIRAKLVDEIYVTICPVIFGGRSAPSLADGEGISQLTDAIKLKLKRREFVGGELYCVYKCLPASRTSF